MEQKSNYQRKLAHPDWQRKRLEVLQRDNFTCQFCNSTEKELHVHHKFYYPDFTPPQNYPLESMISLCYECHEEEERKMADFPKLFIQRAKEAGFDSECIVMLYSAFMDINNDKKRCMQIIKAAEIMKLWEKESPEMIEKINADMKILHPKMNE